MFILPLPDYSPPLPTCDSSGGRAPTAYDCNRAIYNLGCEDGILRSPVSVTRTYGNCRIDVTCPGGPVTVSSGRLLHDVDSSKSGGYQSLSKTCLATGKVSEYVNK
ncbi:hypothetical protein CROQUDRAFT_49660 [Cronartium quercuum f. sp. fusiforme G11]|uniref:Uncharacterized protein n=1 Tax=Cronartium quercuum f. sp. fusiforme G11 TaxID=708437 RepID=A0A9P6NAA3_9BASI|nr:hypothetical protein CROQUDRAFT_49660 [Cronartium quercuum f. sp. fusiforme G11]